MKKSLINIIIIILIFTSGFISGYYLNNKNDNIIINKSKDIEVSGDKDIIKHSNIKHRSRTICGSQFRREKLIRGEPSVPRQLEFFNVHGAAAGQSVHRV